MASVEKIAGFTETSARIGNGVPQLFQEISSYVLKNPGSPKVKRKFSNDDDELAMATVQETPSPGRGKEIFYSESSMLSNATEPDWKDEYDRLQSEY